MRLHVLIEIGEDGTYDANLEFSDKVDFGLFGQGNTIDEAIADFYNSEKEIKELYAEQGKYFPENLEYIFKLDTASFLSNYKGVLSLSGIGRLTGINRKQLNHYATGISKPSPKTVKKIEEAIHEFGKELSQLEFA